MPLLDELVNHVRAEAARLANTPAAQTALADVRHLETLVAKRAEFAQAAFHQAEVEARDWLTSRLHPTPAQLPLEESVQTIEGAPVEPVTPSVDPAAD